VPGDSIWRAVLSKGYVSDTGDINDAVRSANAHQFTLRHTSAPASIRRRVIPKEKSLYTILLNPSMQGHLNVRDKGCFCGFRSII
jgi:hypothetical protein